MKRALLIFVVLCFCGVGWVWGQIPQAISYQGRLSDASGNPVADGSYNLTFKLYDVSSGGVALWSETQSVTTSKGLFTAILGAVTPLSLAFDRPYWLGLTLGASPEMTPRRPVNSSAYSFISRTVIDTAITTAKLRNNAVSTTKLQDNSVTAAKIQPNIVSSLNSVTNDGGNIDLVAGTNVTVTPNNTNKTITIATAAGGGDITSVTAGTGLSGGGTSGDVTLSVAVPLSLTGSVAGEGAIIKGQNAGGGYGLYGKATSGAGVYGEATVGSGVRGYVDNGSAVAGNAVSGYALWGQTPHGTGVYGLSNDSVGVKGESVNWRGVQGTSAGSIGVFGSSINYIGMWAETKTANRNALEAFNLASNNYALLGGPVGGVAGSSTDSAGVAGTSTNGKGVFGTSTAGVGVYGKCTSGSGLYGMSTNNYGVQSVSQNGDGFLALAVSSGKRAGVFANQQDSAFLAGPIAAKYGGYTFGVNGKSVSGIGVVGLSESNDGVYGRSETGTGVMGATVNGTVGVKGYGGMMNGVGVYGQSLGPGATLGVHGEASYIGVAGGATVTGVWGTGVGTNGTGVYGVADSGNSAIGVWGESYRGVGVYGRSSTNDGVWGESDGANKSGILGVSNNPSGYAGYFYGTVYVNGNLGKAGGSFKIDHPLHPANKYLQHSFVESPDMMNVYNGNIITDGNGDATVILPAWFEALNKDFRYQLTVIGQFAHAIVANEITGNQFTIKTDKPNVKVSWQVTGIRHDAWAEAHRIQVEVDKQGAERGKYLHPAELGQPETSGIEYEKSKSIKPKPSIH